jgi:hypothetical protein
MLHLFVGGEAVPAGLALAAAADGDSFLRFARVNDLVFGGTALRAAHGEKQKAESGNRKAEMENAIGFWFHPSDFCFLLSAFRFSP